MDFLITAYFFLSPDSPGTHYITIFLRWAILLAVQMYNCTYRCYKNNRCIHTYIRNYCCTYVLHYTIHITYEILRVVITILAVLFSRIYRVPDYPKQSRAWWRQIPNCSCPAPRVLTLCRKTRLDSFLPN